LSAVWNFTAKTVLDSSAQNLHKVRLTNCPFLTVSTDGRRHLWS